MGLVTDKFTKFTDATIVAGGDSVAIDMWHGTRTGHIRKEFEKMHIGVRQLSEEWGGLSPVNHLRHFKNKKVKLVMATADKVILTKYQKALADRLRAQGADLTLKKCHLGHVLTCFRFYLFGSPL